MLLRLDTSKPRVQYDIAYACYLLLGLSLPVGLILLSIMDPGEFGFLVFLPSIPLFLVVIVIGAGFSIRLWRHEPLPLLGAWMALNMLLGLLTGKAFFEVALSIPAIAIPLWWFFYFSRRAQKGVGNVLPRSFYQGAPRAHYDIAYGCFLLFGFSALVGEIFASIPLDFFIVLLPLSYLSSAAFVIGVAFSIRLWRHALLRILAALTVLIVLGGFFLGADALTDPRQAFWFQFINVVTWAYGITVIIIAMRWFLILRRRARSVCHS